MTKKKKQQPELGLVYGYTRVSEGEIRRKTWARGAEKVACEPEPSLSCDAQEAEIKAKIEELGLPYGRTFRDHDVGAVDVRWYDRPGFMEMLGTCRPGDGIMVVSLDRIERGGPIPTSVVFNEMLKRQIRLWALREFRDGPMDMENGLQQLHAQLYSWMAHEEAQKTRDRTKAALGLRRSLGLRTQPYPPLGQKFVRVKHPLKPGKAWGVVPDPQECTEIVDIYRRRMRGESYADIARGFIERQAKTAHGRLWVPRQKASPSDIRLRRSSSYWNHGRLRAAFKLVQKLVESGETELFGVPIRPREVEKPHREQSDDEAA